jgi:DNA topoisomerase-3
LKQLLRDGDGIGTPATRAQIIKDLKKRAFLESKGKKIRSTEIGRALVDAVPQAVRDPSLTALYERVLKHIEQGTASLDDFIAKQESFIRSEVSRTKSASGPVSGLPGAEPSRLHKCMSCGKPLARRTAKGTKRLFWGCTGFPDCRQNYADSGGKPHYTSAKGPPHEHQ